MKLNFILFMLWLILIISHANTQESWTFLNTKSIGASKFLKNNPAANGKNVTIFILDSGVDVATPGLYYLPDGNIKIVDVQDYSGEGDVYLNLAEMGSENNEKYLQAADG